MLKFYGIRFSPQGSPERYEFSIALRESLNASLHMHARYAGDLEKTLAAIDREVDRLYLTYPNAQTKTAQFRFLLAKWLRAKDIARFLFDELAKCPLRPKVARILDSPLKIEEKWGRIEPPIVQYLFSLQPKAREEMLSHPNSEVGLLLQMINLFFLEQDEESPPVNLDLLFIKKQFPKIVWKKADGISTTSSPFWLPENPYCRIPFLLSRLTAALHRLEIELLKKALITNPVLESGRSSIPPDTVKSPPAPLSLGSIMPSRTPDEVQLIHADSSKEMDRATLIPETVGETLLSLQKTVQKRFSHEGVKHLIGILRQIVEKQSRHICEFDVAEHFRLVARITKKGECSKRQRGLFERVFEMLGGLRVIRCWNNGKETRKITTPLIAQIGMQQWSSVGSFEIKKLLLDPLFFPNRKNPYRLGIHLRLIPRRLFQESSHRHALLPGLSSYLYGSWLNDTLRNRGVLEKSASEIVEGGAFNVAAANRYRILQKLESELKYMERKKYVGTCRIVKSPNGNPWEDLYRIRAPEEALEMLGRFRQETISDKAEQQCG